MVKKKEFNTWMLLGLSKKELFVGLLIFVLSGVFFRSLGKLIWRKKALMLRDKAVVLRPKINELTIQEISIDVDDLSLRLDSLNNDFLTHDKSLMENSERFRDINKVYLELRLRLNHIIHELELKVNEIYRTKKIDLYNDKMDKMKESLDLLNEELQRETDENQSYTLNMLTLVETIFLPLGVMTGYFGMNFSSMGGHVGKGHVPAPGLLGIKYGQGFVWGIMLICILMILYSFNWDKMEHFDNKGVDNCDNKSVDNCERRDVKPFNVLSQDLRKINEKAPEFPNILDLPYDDINFYSDVIN
jgi:hypothetical protein